MESRKRVFQYLPVVLLNQSDRPKTQNPKLSHILGILAWFEVIQVLQKSLFDKSRTNSKPQIPNPKLLLCLMHMLKICPEKALEAFPEGCAVTCPKYVASLSDSVQDPMPDCWPGEKPWTNIGTLARYPKAASTKPQAFKSCFSNTSYKVI